MRPSSPACAMNREIWWSAKLAIGLQRRFIAFAQAMANRLMCGDTRYGVPDAGQLYLDKLKRELKAYEDTGNQEHLFNVANYCLLETHWPQHERSHLRGARSVRRSGRMERGKF